MADTSFNKFHLALMEDFLPIGMGIIKRAKKRSIGQLFNGLSSSEDTFASLRNEGIKSAKDIRDKLDQLSPGLGNPVVEVQVAENIEEYNNVDVINKHSLTDILCRIEDRLSAIQEKINNLDSNV